MNELWNIPVANFHLPPLCKISRIFSAAVIIKLWNQSFYRPIATSRYLFFCSCVCSPPSSAEVDLASLRDSTSVACMFLLEPWVKGKWPPGSRFSHEAQEGPEMQLKGKLCKACVKPCVQSSALQKQTNQLIKRNYDSNRSYGNYVCQHFQECCSWFTSAIAFINIRV